MTRKVVVEEVIVRYVEGGRTKEVSISFGSDGQYMQSGASTDVLGATLDIAQAVEDAIRDSDWLIAG